VTLSSLPKNNPQNYSSPFENGSATLQHRSSRTPLSSQTNLNTLRSKTSDIALGQDVESQPNSSKGTKRLVRKKSSQATSVVRGPGEDESYWIHRDKLAQIESRELEEFSIRLGRRVSERNESTSEQAEKRQRLASPVRMDEAPEDHEHNEETSSSSPKSYNAKTGNRPAANSVNSRIPIPRSFSGSSPPGELPNGASRSRSNSMGMSHSPEQSPISSRPTRQQGGQDYNDNLEQSSPDSPPGNYRTTSNTSANNSSSPQKQSGSKSRRPNANQRTPSQQKQPPRGTPTPTSSSSRQTPNDPKRPGTSSGRPGTSHRPEGEPPWIASMYKPDPRLPPDQQMLPTHAKRMAQEQWEREGKTGTAYDRDFRLLNDNEFPDKPPSNKGYRTMPSIARAATPLQQEQGQHQQQQPQVVLGELSVTPMGGFDDYDEEVGKKKGCVACCVVM
jgi:hypothetical protein